MLNISNYSEIFEFLNVEKTVVKIKRKKIQKNGKNLLTKEIKFDRIIFVNCGSGWRGQWETNKRKKKNKTERSIEDYYDN